MERNGWQELVVEARAVAPPLSDERFRDWMTGRPIFVSSVMDDEMQPARTAVRDWVRRWGGDPVMWEAIVPRDQRAQHAYLDGVDRSRVFVLLLGSAYGVSDDTGFSPTHKEGNRAAERGIPRLLFLRDGVRDSERDGRLNAWIRSLYNELSGARYGDAADLVVQMEARLRELASQQETYWVKLSQLVFPGTVQRRNADGSTTFVVRSRLRDPAVRRAVGELGTWKSGRRFDRLTWANESHAVNVEDVDVEGITTSEDAVEIRCRLAQNQGGSPFASLGGVTHVSHGREYGPVDQTMLWARQAVFGEEPAESQDKFLRAMIEHEGPPLPAILAAQGTRGWLAEGLIRLYLVEGFAHSFGGVVERLEVGPATATAVRVYAVLRLPGYEQRLATIEGAVRLPR